MRIKNKYYIATVGALFTALFLLFALLFIVKPDKTTSASAATNAGKECTINGRVEGASGIPWDVDVTSNFTVTMRTLSSSGSGRLEQNAKLDWTYISIQVNVTKISEHKSFRLMKDGAEYEKKAMSGKNTVILYSGRLPDGNYTMYYQVAFTQGSTFYNGLNYVFQFSIDTTAPQYSLTAGGTEISNGSFTNQNIKFSASDPNFQRIYYKRPGASSYLTTADTSLQVYASLENSGWWEFYATDSLGQASERVKLYLDCLPPELSCSSVGFGGTTEERFTVTAKDGSGTVKLFVKYEDEEWFSEGGSYTVSDSERSGRYYFYAEDGIGNRSETSWIVLSTEEPAGSLIKSETDNSYTFVWNNQYWSATLDGESYTEGRLITNEGIHEIVLSNNATKKKNYTFKIDHCYKVINQTPATCYTDGVNEYECSQCGDRYEETLYSSGHHYVVVSTPSSCTDSEHILYTCSMCGEQYEAEGAYPTGHSYVSTITKQPTCTEDGERKIACEKCGEEQYETIAASGHSYGIAEVVTKKGITTRIYICSQCGGQYKQNLGNQYEEVSNYMEYLFRQYQPYMWWVFLASAGVWSIAIGVMIVIANKHEEKEKAKKMLVNYVIGLVVIAVVLVACPYLMRGIAAVIS